MSVKLRRRELDSGRVSLYLDIYHNGQRRYEFLQLYLDPDSRQANKETLRLAESIRAKRQLELQNHQHGFVAQFKRKTDFVQFFAQLAEEKEHRSWSNTLVKLRDFTGGTIQFKGITDRWLERFKEFLLGDVAQSTARLYFSKIRAALNQAVKDRIIPSSPADRVDHIPPVESERVFLTEDEIRQMAAAPCKYDDLKRAFLFGCYTGLRLSDIRALRWKHIQNGRIHFKQKKTNGREYVPLSKQARSMLGECDDPDDPVFSLPSHPTITRHMKKWREATGIDKHVTFHVSRHTFATLALSSGTDLYTVSKLLGHTDIKHTQVYARIIDEKKQEAVDRLPEIEL